MNRPQILAVALYLMPRSVATDPIRYQCARCTLFVVPSLEQLAAMDADRAAKKAIVPLCLECYSEITGN